MMRRGGALARAAVLATLLLALPHTARAEDCRATFATLRWTMTQKGASDQIATDRAGADLLGKACDVNFLKPWFATAGWQLTIDWQHPGEKVGPPGGQYRQDRSIRFCKPRKWPLRSVGTGCASVIDVSLFQGRITRVRAGAPK